MKKLYPLLVFFLCVHLAWAQYEVLVSNQGGNSVPKYDVNGNYLGDLVSPGSGGLASTQDIMCHPNGTILVTGFTNSEIKQYDGAFGSYIGGFTNGYTLVSPSKMSIGKDSLIYVTQWGTTQNKVARFDLSGNFVDEFPSIGIDNGLGHVWDAAGNFYIAQFGNGGNGTVHKFDSLGNDLGTFINSTVLQGPTSIWWDTNWDMLVEDWTTGNVLRYDSTGQYVGVFLTGMTSPEGIAFLPNGDMLIGDWGQDVVHQYDSSGNYIGPFASTGLIDPNCVEVRLSPLVGEGEVMEEEVMIQVHPNPSNGQLNIVGASQDTQVRLLDMKGQQIHTSHGQQLDIQHLPNGAYVLKVGGHTEKVVLQR